MTSLQPCPSCACHVKRQDAQCPFCRAICSWRPVAAPAASRMSRGQWLALGSTMALLGCSGASGSTSPGDGGAGSAQERAGDAAVCPTRSGYFTCGGNVCDRSVQVCVERSSLCVPTDALGPFERAAPPVQCGACPTCDCLQPALISSCHCQEDDAGTIRISCAGCYGAPPARLDRLTDPRRRNGDEAR